MVISLSDSSFLQSTSRPEVPERSCDTSVDDIYQKTEEPCLNSSDSEEDENDQGQYSGTFLLLPFQFESLGSP
jgi:hypothetical protein